MKYKKSSAEKGREWEREKENEWREKGKGDERKLDAEEIKEEEDRKRGEKGEEEMREGFTSFSKKKHNKTDEWKSVGELL